MLKEYLLKQVNFEKDEINFISNLIGKIDIAKNENLVREDRVCNRIYFVNEGLLKSSISDGVDEIVIEFIGKGEFATDYVSYLKEEKSDMDITALEDSTLEFWDRKSINLIYTKCKNFQKFGRLMAEYHFMHLATRVKRAMLPAKTKYQLLLRERPELLQKVPQYLLASYLNITPEWLSKIRAEK